MAQTAEAAAEEADGQHMVRPFTERVALGSGVTLVVDGRESVLLDD